MRKILCYIAALTFLPSSVLAENLSEEMEQRVLSELTSRSGITAGELQLILNDCDLNQRNMNLCALEHAIRAELLLEDAIQLTGAKTDHEYSEWQDQLQNRCVAESEAEAGGGSMQPMLISECKELAMLAERYQILGPESFPPPPQPPHKWDLVR